MQESNASVIAKRARVSVIKDNIKKGDLIPQSEKDCDVGQWVDAQMAQKGHTVDQNGIVDLPEFGIDNKTRKFGSKAHHTVGSMTINDIINTQSWYDTRYYKKALNQNQVQWSDIYKEVVDVTILDMDMPEIQQPLQEAYEDLRKRVVAGDRSKNIISGCGWAVFDGYNHSNSYRFRITDKAMNKIKNMSRSRDTRKRLFEE